MTTRWRGHARSEHGEQIANPPGLRGVSGQGAVWAVVADELLKVSE
jgi:hypothetical protein